LGHASNGFDCSGLVMDAVFESIGIELEHSAASQWVDSASDGGQTDAENALALWDLVFFAGPDWCLELVVRGSGTTGTVLSDVDAQHGVTDRFDIGWYTSGKDPLTYVGAVRVP
jgi:cell wall-associated NlpC family hydrolase